MSFSNILLLSKAVVFIFFNFYSVLDIFGTSLRSRHFCKTTCHSLSNLCSICMTFAAKIANTHDAESNTFWSSIRVPSFRVFRKVICHREWFGLPAACGRRYFESCNGFPIRLTCCHHLLICPTPVVDSVRRSADILRTLSISARPLVRTSGGSTKWTFELRRPGVLLGSIFAFVAGLIQLASRSILKVSFIVAIFKMLFQSSGTAGVLYI